MFNLGHGLDWNGVYYKFTVLMVFLNCTVNPFIYLIKYKDYQEALKLILRCKKYQSREETKILLNTISSVTTSFNTLT